MFDDELHRVSLEIEHELEKATFDLLRKFDGAISAREAHKRYLLMDAIFFDTLRKSLRGDAKAIAGFRRAIEDVFISVAESAHLKK